MNYRHLPRFAATLLCFATIMNGKAVPENDIPAQIAKLPWDGVVITDSNNRKAQIKVTCHFSKKGVVHDTEIHRIWIFRVQSYAGLGGKVPFPDISVISSTSARDCIGVWCDGGGRVDHADRNGFDYNLQLAWQKTGEKVIHFDETFPCRWVKSQTFDRKGLHLEVEVALNDGA